MDNFFKNLKKLNKPKQEGFGKILPSDVRYSLQYNEGMIGRDGIEALIMSNFGPEGFYLMAKSKQNTPEDQKNFVESYAKKVLENINDLDFKNFLINELNKKPDISVNAVKLAQISRQGFELWQEKYEKISEKLSQNPKEVFILAHSTFIGLDHFIKNFSKIRKNLNIIVPNWLDENKEHIGYSLKFENDNLEVSWLDKHFEKAKVILFDDTIKTGSTLNKIQDLWSKTSHELPEVTYLDKVVQNH